MNILPIFAKNSRKNPVEPMMWLKLVSATGGGNFMFALITIVFIFRFISYYLQNRCYSVLLAMVMVMAMTHGHYHEWSYRTA